MTDPKTLVDKLWNYCNILRDDGLSYGDYVEQLTYLLFLKMADEQTRPPFNRDRIIPEDFDWPSLLARDGEELEAHYLHVLNELGRMPGMLGIVFRKAQNRIQDPAKLRRLIVDLMDQEEWMILDADVKGDLYEGLLQKNAEDVKTGAGQYFTPRPLIKAMVDVMRPGPDETICDPASGTGGFLIAAHEYIASRYQLDPDQKRHMRFSALRGTEIVDNTARLCVMNLLLHGIGAPNGDSPIDVDDSLAADPGNRYSMVLTNPPFGKKSSMTIIGAEGETSRESLTVVREDFWATTSNKQLNFVQHVKTLLDIEGRAAVVVPDNVLFEGGAGESVRRRLLQECDVHTLLRLPTGIFYAQGVKANVLFFDRKPASEHPWTKELWIYDLRTNQHFTLKQNPLTYEHLVPFIDAYNSESRHAREESERFKRFTYEDLLARDKVSLDITWLRDESLEDTDNLPPPEVIAAEIAEDLEAALTQFAEIASSLRARQWTSEDTQGSD
ncbi:MAG: type I restriction-modification system subunit M [Actinobacteria bacterium]|nr:type I restriction-modification system subunit M [Actinomycetota bacterium]